MHLADPITQPEFYQKVASKRLMAWVIDTVLIALTAMLIVPFTAFTAIFFFFGLMAVVGFIYRTITLASGSATWGMRMMGIELRDTHGAILDLQSAFLHTLGYTVSWAFAPLQLISVVLMASSNRGRGLTDHIMGSAALNRRNP
ncbi:MAG: RDD family protein [Tateyamaria sp.]|nr:RDD family protein [Tateyamaria sp.]MDG1336283.1 RDD family protein [Tateyamaria sp.]MDG2056688.1 RDD family protein [Tateyamaria sp.]